MWDSAYRWITALAGLALISAVLVTGAAAADGTIRPDDRAVHGPGAIAASSSSASVRPDDRANHGPGVVTEITPTEVQAPAGSRFDWLDAGIGAVGVIGLGLLTMGAAALVLRRRRSAAFS